MKHSLLAACALLAIACSDSGPRTLSSVVVRPSDTTLVLYQTGQLRGAALDGNDNALAGYNLSWSSSNPSVVSVDNTGHVTAAAVGSAVVTATTSGASGSSTVTVIPIQIASVTVSPPHASVEADHGTFQLSASAVGESGQMVASAAFTWKSSNTSLATVDATTGLVTGLVAGSVVITATANGVSGADTMTVVPPSVASLSVSLAADTIDPNQTTQATVTLYDGRHNIIPNGPAYPVTWTSSNQGVATVNGSGLVAAAGTGTTAITASSQSAKDSAAITVLPPVAQVVLTPSPDTIPVAQTGMLTVTLLDANGNHLSGRTVTWTTNDSTIAAVDPQSGVISGHATGNTVITATSEGQSGSATVYIAVAWSTVSIGFGHACALTTNHLAYCWGFNGEGELGNGSITGPSLCGMNPCSLVPVAVAPPPGATAPLQFQKIAAGEFLTCGITVDYNLYCWGEDFGPEPSLVSLAGVNGQLQVLSVGDNHACVTTLSALTYCLGDDTYGQLGTALAGGATYTGVLVQVAQPISFFYLDNNLAAGGQHTCATPYGSLSWCWGSDQFGQLGVATSNNSCSNGVSTFACSFTPVQLSPPPSVFYVISAGENHTCGVGQNDGVTYCWGHNAVGQLGNGTTTDATVPTPVSTSFGPFVLVRAGDNASCALDTNGTPYCWGSVIPGGSSAPQRMQPALTFTALAVGTAACGVTSGGAIYCAGYGGNGEMGNGAANFSATFVRALAPADPGLQTAAALRVVARRRVTRNGVIRAAHSMARHPRTPTQH